MAIDHDACKPKALPKLFYFCGRYGRIAPVVDESKKILRNLAVAVAQSRQVDPETRIPLGSERASPINSGVTYERSRCR
jgi:hypothetical protein